MAPSSPPSTDSDDSFAEDLDAIRSALTLTGAAAAAAAPSPSDPDSDSGDEDLELLRSLQTRFSSTPASGVTVLHADVDSIPIISPLSFISPSTHTDEDSDDDLATLRAIRRRFSQYDGSREPLEETEEPCLQPSRVGLESQFPRSAELFVEALKKNRACQRFIRKKLIEIEAKIEENKNLRERVKCLMEFQVDSKRKAGRMLGQKKDPRVRLVSMRTTTVSRTKKGNLRKVPVLYSGPPENSCVSDYKSVMRRFPFLVKKKTWSNIEKENLAKGIKQQYQELIVLNSMSLGSDLDGSADSNLMLALSSKDLEVTPEKIRAFLPLANWDRLASMYVIGRSGAECEARWLNCEDPMINHNPWTTLEDKKLLFIVQDKGVYNWIDIAILLGTQRTPFQCLARYQRSLNPHILKRDWTADEDAMLRSAVENFGENNWQMVASCLEGRTGTQCSNRWRKSILPARNRVGRWSIEEDKQLKAAVTLFGAKNWNKIAQFVPGRTQVQCRERWLNCLNPSLNLEDWTAEEDAMLLDAIHKHDYCWSKVAQCVPPRTDSQCMRRWKVLLPHEVPLLQAARQIKKSVLISNFVDRESERPLIGPNDFSLWTNASVTEKVNRRTRMKRSSDSSLKASRAKSKKPHENPVGDDVMNAAEDSSNIGSGPRKRRSNKTSSDSSLKTSRAKSKKPHENPVGDDVMNAAEDSSNIGSGPRKRRSNKTSSSLKASRAKSKKPHENPVGGDVMSAAEDSSNIGSGPRKRRSNKTSSGNAPQSGSRKRKRNNKSSSGSAAEVQPAAACDDA